MNKIKYNIVNKKNSPLPIVDLIELLFSNRNSTIENYISENLFHFSLLDSFDLASEILLKTIVNKERICIVADYDSDGATSCAIAYRGLKMFGANVSFIVPNRFKHGYGLTRSVVEEAIELYNPNLILTVDNGISSFEGIDFCNNLGIKTIITDHHLAGETLPLATAIVNPNKGSCEFPSKNLAGCGVIFYLLLALKNLYREKVDSKFDKPIFNLVDFVAIGTVADLVKIDPNNMLLIKYGLSRIRKGKSFEGINALVVASNKSISNLSTADIGFSIAPKINAAGRLADMSVGIKLLVSDDPVLCYNLANELSNLNIERKSIENEMKEVSLLSEATIKKDYSAVSYDPTYHEGVIGILASRIKDLHYLPTIVFSDCSNEGYLKGSCRSIKGVHIRDVLDYVHKSNPDLIIKFGGHSMAAGLTIIKDKLPVFIESFNYAVSIFAENKNIFENILEIDCRLFSEEINLDFAKFLEQQIWGQAFPCPIFYSEVTILNQSVLAGKHLKMTISVGNKNVEAIYFNYSDLIDKKTVNLVYQISINRFRGEEKLQLLVNGLF